jgi:hypothetical protein
MDDVSSRAEELADVADAPIDGEGRDGEEAGNGDLREPEPVMEPVGEGEGGAPSGARGRPPRGAGGRAVAETHPSGLPNLQRST